MTERVPQINDDVILTLVLPEMTEEWADDELGRDFDVRRDEKNRLVVTERIGGNCNGIVNARGFLQEVEDALSGCNVDPMRFTLTCCSVPA